MPGLLGDIFSAGNVAKRKLTDLLGNPLLSAQQFVGNLNDRARILNEMTSAAAQEGVNYGPASRQLAGLLAEAYNPIGMVVYHGSPAKFSRFDPTKIGSGEGAQAYGYGHYVAQSPEVAKGYQQAVSKDKFVISKGFFDPSELEHLNVRAEMRKGDIAKAIEIAKKYSQPDSDYPEVAAKAARDLAKLEQINASGGAKSNPGVFYEIDLPDEQIARMLDFDKPLMQQSKEIQALAKQYGLTDADHMGGDLIAAMDAKRPAGAELMRQAGVPGIRYLDQGSRGTGEGTSNFVVFPGGEDLLTILKRNGGLLGP